jgi:hypothetical protein
MSLTCFFGTLTEALAAGNVVSGPYDTPAECATYCTAGFFSFAPADLPEITVVGGGGGGGTVFPEDRASVDEAGGGFTPWLAAPEDRASVDVAGGGLSPFLFSPLASASIDEVGGGYTPWLVFPEDFASVDEAGGVEALTTFEFFAQASCDWVLAPPPLFPAPTYWWKINEGSGTAIGDSADSANATLTSGAWASAGPTGVAVSNTPSSSVNIDTPAFDPNNLTTTFTTFVRCHPAPNYNLLGLQPTSSWWWAYVGTTFVFRVGNATTAPTSDYTGAWHSFCLVVHGTSGGATQDIYVDCSYLLSTASSLLLGSAIWRVGCPSNTATCLIADWRMWANTELTATQVLAVHNDTSI